MFYDHHYHHINNKKTGGRKVTDISNQHKEHIDGMG